MAALVPPNNAASVALPAFPQNPTTLGDVTNAQDYLQRLYKSRDAGIAGGATAHEIGLAETYKAAVLFSSQPAGNVVPQWLQQLNNTVEQLNNTVEQIRDNVASLKADVAAIKATSENTRRVLRNQKRAPVDGLLPLLKWKPGHGAALARAATHPRDVQPNDLLDPADDDVPTIGSAPLFDCTEPTGLSAREIVKLIVFYNDDFNIVRTDNLTKRRDKYRWFLQNEAF
ncbi:hypothetical protein FPV67DRAFT_1662436 [Lyophyllum atratum]|nr:hypothetical protein FPV67DRAFT_1662436 [Lyophyllum atratum]